MNLEKLKERLPEEAVKQHPTKTYLSSIKGVYVTERFNEVFGVGKWSVKVRHETTGENGMVVVHVIFEVKEENIYYECFGGNDNGGEQSKNFDLGDAYKGATTDALTKIGSYLGVGIDVFKGLQTGSKTPVQPDNRKWFNVGSESWNKALQQKASLETVMKHYKVSKQAQEQYKNELKLQ